MKLFVTNIKNGEERLFEVVLLVSVIFWLLRIVTGFVLDTSISLVISDLVTLMMVCLLIRYLRKGVDIALLTKVYCVALLPVFVINWMYSGGMEGSSSYAYFSILVIYLGILRSRSRLFMVTLLCLTNVILTLDGSSEILFSISPINLHSSSIAWNYLLYSVIVAAIVVFIKVKFDKEREGIEIQNSELDRVNKELSLKHELLTNQQRQIKMIQNNLEELVHERTIELENKNKELESYAHDNVHIVRRPLSNILGLLDIIENETDQKDGSHIQLKSIQKSALELDEVVKKINMILK